MPCRVEASVTVKRRCVKHVLLLSCSQVLNPVMAPGMEWWLDAEASCAAAAPLADGSDVPEGAIAFTLRPGAPIYLTREQV